MQMQDDVILTSVDAGSHTGKIDPANIRKGDLIDVDGVNYKLLVKTVYLDCVEVATPFTVSTIQVSKGKIVDAYRVEQPYDTGLYIDTVSHVIYNKVSNLLWQKNDSDRGFIQIDVCDIDFENVSKLVIAGSV